MSDRIKELAEQALRNSMVHDGMYRPEGYANGVSKDFADKFAELIIKECAKQAYDYICDHENQRYWNDVGSDCIPGDTQSHIKEYFGVK